MFINIIWLLGFVAVVVLFAWLVRRAWGAKNAVVKWVGVMLAGLVTLLFALVTLAMGKGMYDLYHPYPVAPVTITVAGTPDQVARGEHLASVVCAGCHTLNGELPLTGGFNLSQDSGLPLGDIYPPNITPAGRIKDLSDVEIFRTIRVGVRRDGVLTFMAGVPVHYLSDEDVNAVIAYLRKSQPIDKPTPTVTYSPLVMLLAGAGLITIDVPATITPVQAPAKAVTKEYGEYVMKFMDCRGCHGPNLDGNAPPPSPPGAANLTVVVTQWSKDDFFKAMRTGVDLTGHQIRPPMPWKNIGKLDDVELEALYVYLHGLTPILKK